jgi:hypothetical protein
LLGDYDRRGFGFDFYNLRLLLRDYHWWFVFRDNCGFGLGFFLKLE